MNVVVTGGTGFIGRLAVARLLASGHGVAVLSRDPAAAARLLPPGARSHPWDGAGEDAVRSADAILNLAGEPIAQRWTSIVRGRLLSSRLTALDRLRTVVQGTARRPAVLVSASAVGYYGDRAEEELDEESAPADDFLGRICVKWEEAANALAPLGLRVATVRIGVVLGTDGGALQKMLPAFRLGGGGPVGSGRQWMSWIHVDDAASLLVFALETAGVLGPLNAVAPEPVRNAGFAKALGAALHRPAILPVPAVAVKMLFGEMGQLVLGGQKVFPKRALAAGFEFAHPTLPGALENLLR